MAKRGLPLSLVLSMFLGLIVAGNAAAAAPEAVVLGTAGNFAVLGASTVTNTGLTEITGDVGVSPGSAITGFPPGVTDGIFHAADVVAAEAQEDLATAYNFVTTLACETDLTGQDLGGLTLTPGVYCFDTSVGLTGTLTLDAEGDPDVAFIFQIGSTITTASASLVDVINDAQECNVFWQVGSSATLGTTTSFVGNIMALTSITVTTGSSIDGRAMAMNGAVTMDSNAIARTTCALSGPTECTSTLTGGTYTDIAVPDGGTCTLIGVSVETDVTVGIGSTLITQSQTTIGGDVTSVRARSVQLIDSDALGNIDVSGTTGSVVIGSAGCLVDPIAGGDLVLRGNRGTVAVCMMSVGGNLIVKSNRNRVGIFDNIVTGNVVVQYNTGSGLRAFRNTVDGIALFSRNKIGRVFLVQDNSMGGDLRCNTNTRDPLHTGNTVVGLRLGECAGPE